MNELNVNCLICNNNLKNQDNKFICTNKDHYFGAIYDVDHRLIKYIIGYLFKNNIEFSLASPYKKNNLKTEYAFKVSNNTKNSCRYIGNAIFHLELNEEEYFKLDTFNIDKVKNHLRRIYELTIFI